VAKTSVTRPHRLPQPGKLQIYQQQYSLNLALENVIFSCQQLQTLTIIPRGFLALYANMAEELRTLINCKIIETMLPIESADAKRFQNARLKWETRPYPQTSTRPKK
jgi:hypothetical protein